MDDRPVHDVALAMVAGLGARRWAELVARFDGARNVLLASRAALATTGGIGPRLAARILAADLEAAERLLARVEAEGGVTLVPRHPQYPELLREIPDPPPVLFAAGRLELLQATAVSMVGSRDHTSYGAAVAQRLAGALARAGLVVVSGMARGIDAVAHEAALDAGGGSVGVLGNGLGVVYPAANRALYDRMARAGCLLTEFPPGERPQAGAFQARNRLVSGMAMTLVVVEAGERSGTAITVRHATDQGRTVLAVPGPITSRASWGTNRLIRDGAKPVLDPESVLEEYRVPGAPLASLDPAGLATPEPPSLSPDEDAIFRALTHEPVHVDHLAATTARPVGEVLATLSILEVQGLVRHEPGTRYARA